MPEYYIGLTVQTDLHPANYLWFLHDTLIFWAHKHFSIPSWAFAPHPNATKNEDFVCEPICEWRSREPCQTI